jgi:hypothetical protein
LLLGLLCSASCSNGNGDPESKGHTPDTPSVPERFIAPRDGIALDSRTGLEWTKRDNARDVSWDEAESYCRELTVGDRVDWRLPEIDQLKELYDTGLEQPCGDAICHLDPSVGLTNPYVWSGTQRGSRRFYFDFRFGTSLAPRLKPGLVRRVLCVRGLTP